MRGQEKDHDDADAIAETALASTSVREKSQEQVSRRSEYRRAGGGTCRPSRSLVAGFGCITINYLRCVWGGRLRHLTRSLYGTL